MDTRPQNPVSLDTLLQQIEELNRIVSSIQSGAIDIIQSSNTQASLQLQDVLKATENATMNILDAANALQSMFMESPLGDKEKNEAGKHITRVYEACSFQDITGQRIKKVLKEFEVLEKRIVQLADMVRGGVVNVPRPEAANSETPLSGPQLSDEVPSQEDIDKLFGE